MQLTLDGIGFGQRTATIMVTDTSGQPVVANEVVLSPVMESMGMAAPETIAQPADPGDYEAKGEFFSMIGEWQVNVRVHVGGNGRLRASPSGRHSNETALYPTMALTAYHPIQHAGTEYTPMKEVDRETPDGTH